MAFRTIEVALSANTAQFTARFGAAAGSVRDLGREINQAARRSDEAMQGLGRAGVVMGGAIAAGFGASVKAAVDFESAFAGVRKTVNASEAEFRVLRDGIRDMAQQLPTTANEIAGVAEAAGQLGIRRDSILAFTRTMVDLGETTNLAADEAATQLARLANITGMSQGDFDRLGSSVVALGNNLATTESEIVAMGLRIAGAGNQIGLAESDILGFAGALSSVGIEAEAGGSAISKVMIDIASEVENGGDKLATFAEVAGMSADQFATAYRTNAAGALVAFIEGLGNMEQAGGSTLGVLADLGIEEVRMRDALLRASGAGDLLRESLELGADAWEDNTALAAEAEQRYNTTAAQLEILRNNVVDLAIRLGDSLLPVVRGAASTTGALLNTFRDLPGPMQAVVAGTAGVTGAVGLLGGGFVMLAPKIVAARTAMETLSQSAPRTASAIGRMGTGLAVVGGTVGGLVAVKTALDGLGLSARGLELDIEGASRATTEELVEGFRKLEDFDAGAAMEMFGELAEGNIGTARRLRDALADQGYEVQQLDDVLGDAAEAERQMAEDADRSTEALERERQQTAETEEELRRLEERHKSLGAAFGDFTDSLTAWDAVVAANREWAESVAQSTEDASDSWNNYYDGFSVSTDAWIAEMRSQVEAQQEWKTNVAKIAQAGRRDVAEILAGMGPEGAELARRFTELTGDEFQTAADLFVQTMGDGGKRAGEALDRELKVMAEIGRTGGKTTAEAIAEELGMAVDDVKLIAFSYGVSLAEGVNPVPTPLAARTPERDEHDDEDTADETTEDAKRELVLA